MGNNINWKVEGLTLNRSSASYENDHFDVELKGYINGAVVGDLVDISNKLQEKLNKPDTDKKDGLDALADIHRMYIAGGRQNGKTYAQFKMYAKMLGLEPSTKLPEITKVIFNNPATIVIWADETKTVVKAQNNEIFDPEKGLAMAIVKKALGNEGNYFETIKKWLRDYKAIDDLRELCKAIEVYNAKMAARDARNTLINVINDKKATKAELIEAIERAKKYLDKGLDT